MIFRVPSSGFHLAVIIMFEGDKSMRNRIVVMLLSLVAVMGTGLPASAQQVRRSRCIVIFGFKNLRPGKETDWIGDGAAETVANKLSGVAGLAVVERSQIDKILDEKGLQKTNLFDPKTAVKAGKWLGAERVVVGTFAVHSGSIQFNIRVVDVKTAAVCSAATVTGASSGPKLFDTLSKLAEAVVQSFDKKVVIVDARPLVRAAPRKERIVLTDEQKKKLRKQGTANHEAWKAFIKGNKAKTPDEKIRWYTTAIKLDPEYSWPYNNRGVAYNNKGAYDRAIRDCSKAISLNPDYAKAYSNRGIAYDNKNAYDWAIRNYNKAISLKPDYAIAYNNRGVSYSKKSDYSQAIRDYTKAISFKPGYATAYNNRGIAYKNKRDYSRAIRDHTKAISLKPGYASAYNNRGVVYKNKKDYGRAIRDFTSAISFNPNYARAYNNRGSVYRRRNDYNRAIRDHNKAIRLDPNYADAYNKRAVSWYFKKNYNRAWADVRMCHKLGGRVNKVLLRLLRKKSGRSK